MKKSLIKCTWGKRAISLAFCIGFLFGGKSLYALERIVGSSVLFPILSGVCDEFYFQGLGVPPLIEPTGTGGGINLFCSKNSQAPSLVATSRPLSQAEKNRCYIQGVSFIELDLGLDGIVLVHPQVKGTFAIEKEDLYQALKDDPLPLKKWSDLNPDYPAIPVKVLGPPSTAGTYEALMMLLTLKKFRTDEGFKIASDQETVLVQKLMIEKEAYGIISFGFLQKNPGLVYACPINGVMPTYKTIADGSYPLSRRLYLYVNRNRLHKSSHVRKFLDFLVSSYVTASQGLLERLGLIVHSPDHYLSLQAHWRQAS